MQMISADWQPGAKEELERLLLAAMTSETVAVTPQMIEEIRQRLRARSNERAGII